MKELTDQQIKELLSKKLYEIQDSSLQILIRNIIFTMGEITDWQEVYRKMIVFMPELGQEQSDKIQIL